MSLRIAKPNELEIRIPKLHPGQVEVDQSSARFKVLACGRRWGKTKYITRRAVRAAVYGRRYGYFAPTYKVLREMYSEVERTLKPILTSSNKTEHRIESISGGVVEFWTLEDEDAGRSRRYHEIAIDEAALARNLATTWNNAIRPTLTDYRGTAVFAGTPKGIDFFSQLFARGSDPAFPDWQSFHKPTSTNPYIPADEIEAARADMIDRAFRQEYLAEFLEDGGGVFTGVRDAIKYEPGVQFPNAAAVTWTVGVDLARVEDFTVISVVDSLGRQWEIHRFNGISWKRQVDLIVSVAKRFPGCLIRVDSTGVGDPILEAVRGRYNRVEGYHLTSQSKTALIDNLAFMIETGGVALLNDPVQTSELMAYSYELTKSRNVRMSAPAGMHDDTVIALAMAVWSNREQYVPSIGDALDFMT